LFSVKYKKVMDEFLSAFTILDKSAVRLRGTRWARGLSESILAKADGRVPQRLNLAVNLLVSKRKIVLSIKFGDQLVS
ncbi:MAG: hypothetical protein KAJ14_01390, partial [Candidatus Omnitrophica bacterium]|nr:hypothetical protein [Candidatus Omnitrophota bacterium]